MKVLDKIIIIVLVFIIIMNYKGRLISYAQQLLFPHLSLTEYLMNPRNVHVEESKEQSH